MKVIINKKDYDEELSVLKDTLEKMLIAKKLEEHINQSLSSDFEIERSNVRLKLYDARIATLKSHIAYIESEYNLQKFLLEKDTLDKLF